MPEKKWLAGHDGYTVEDLIELSATHRVDSIVAAIEDALLDKADLSDAERIVLTVEAMEREVNNGGFHQFFLNASDEHAPALVAALEEIGAIDTASIVERATQALGADQDWTPEKYELAASRANESMQAELNACDEAYHDSGEAIVEILFEYIRANVADIDLHDDSD